MQGAQVQSLVRELDPTCPMPQLRPGAAKQIHILKNRGFKYYLYSKDSKNIWHCQLYLKGTSQSKHVQNVTSDLSLK